MADTFKVATAADEGLFALLVRCGQQASSDRTPVGVLVITREPQPQDGQAELAVETALSDEGAWRLRRIDVRVARELDLPAADDVLVDAFEHFGGTAFTNLVVEQRGRELFDVTVAFPTRFARYARNSGLVADDLDPGELELAAVALDALGVAHRPSARTLRLRARDLRRPMRINAQIAAFRAAARSGAAQIYCSELPPTRSLRVTEQRLPGATARYRFECVLSLGMAKATLPIEEATRPLERFVAERFATSFGGQSWAVENVHGERHAPRRLGVFDQRKEIRWSVNWGHSRR